MRSRHPPNDVGYTHASSVIPVVKSSEAESFTVTSAVDPLKDRACPNLPPAHVAPLITPVFPLPEASATLVPVPSLKPYAATKPGGGGEVVLLTVTFITVLVVVLPAASRATAVRLCEPFVAMVVFQVIE